MTYEKKSILYYPTIRIEDGYWLRNAILYWDEVASIVPGTNYTEINSPEVEFLREAGIYKPVRPSVLQNNNEICMKFCEEVKENIRYRRKRKFSSSKNQSKEAFSSVHEEKMSMMVGSMVHIDKAPLSVLDFLIEEGIALRNCDGPWINMRTQDAEIYMSVLAKYLAALNNNMDFGTDRAYKFYYPYIKSSSSKVDDKQVYLDIALQEILPMPNLDIPLQDIIDFKMDHMDQLRQFRRHIEAFQWGLKYCSDGEEVCERIAVFRREINDEVNEIDELIRTKNIRTLKKTLRTLVPVALTTGVELMAFHGRISQEGLIAINTMLGVTSSLFGSGNEDRYNEKNSYLFSARDNGIITNYYRRKV